MSGRSSPSSRVVDLELPPEIGGRAVDEVFLDAALRGGDVDDVWLMFRLGHATVMPIAVDQHDARVGIRVAQDHAGRTLDRTAVPRAR